MEIITPPQAGGLGICKGNYSFWHEMSNAFQEFETVEKKEDDLVIVHYTSGPTGPPKGCMMTEGSVIAIFPYAHYCLDIQENDMFWGFADPGGPRCAGYPQRELGGPGHSRSEGGDGLPSRLRSFQCPVHVGQDTEARPISLPSCCGSSLRPNPVPRSRFRCLWPYTLRTLGLSRLCHRRCYDYLWRSICWCAPRHKRASLI